jgi:hypothetical protein
MDELFGYNDGLPSRFPVTMKFDDFTDSQLLEVFTGLVKSQSFKYENDDPKFARIVTRELGRLRGTKVKFVVKEM